MSRIIIRSYAGDAEQYDPSSPADFDMNVGRDGVYDEEIFRDGEELHAAQHVMGLVASNKHFDVRQFVN